MKNDDVDKSGVYIFEEKELSAEEFEGRYTGCYGCGKCKGNLEGYTYLYPDGRSIFRCGREIIAIQNWNERYLKEIIQLLV